MWHCFEVFVRHTNLGNHFPYEIDNFVESMGVHACVRILRLTPGAKAGSPRSMVASLTLETLRGLCASHSVLNPKNNASVWPLPNIRRVLCERSLLSTLISCLLARDEKNYRPSSNIDFHCHRK